MSCIRERGGMEVVDKSMCLGSTSDNSLGAEVIQNQQGMVALVKLWKSLLGDRHLSVCLHSISWNLVNCSVYNVLRHAAQEGGSNKESLCEAINSLRLSE